MKIFILPLKLTDAQVDEATKLIKQNGHLIVDDYSEADLIVTSLNSPPRIQKSIHKVCVPVVSFKWIQMSLVNELSSSSSSKLLNYTPYIVMRPNLVEVHNRDNMLKTKSIMSLREFQNCKYGCQRPTPLECPNNELVELFVNILQSRRLEGKEPSIISYAKAVATLRSYPMKITRDTLDDFTKTTSIGPKTASYIKEYIQTGRIKEADRVKTEEKLISLKLFQSIWGVGVKKSHGWYDQGMRTIQDLQTQNCLNSIQQLWVDHLDDLVSEYYFQHLLLYSNTLRRGQSPLTTV